jgi:hypothetical protein
LPIHRIHRAVAVSLFAVTSLAAANAQNAATPASAAAPASTTPALSPARRAKAQELVTLVHARETTEKYVDNMDTMMKANLQRQAESMSLTPEQKTLLAGYQVNLESLLKKTLSWENMQPEVVNSYAATFTDAELDQIIAFAKTPAGSTFIGKEPELQQNTTTIVQATMKSMQPEVQKLGSTFAAAMQKAAAPEPPVEPPASHKPAPAAPKTAPATPPKG